MEANIDETFQPDPEMAEEEAIEEEMRGFRVVPDAGPRRQDELGDTGL